MKMMAFKKKDINELLPSRKKTSLMAFSLYIGVRGRRKISSEANSVISNTVKKILENKNGFDKNKIKKIEKTSNKIKKSVSLTKIPKKTKSIAVFFGEKLNRAYHFPVYIPSKFVIENDFYIRPLTKIMEEYPRYTVVILERNKARFFCVFLGEIEEESDILRSEVPQRINAARAEWKGLRETRVQGHIEDHLKKHIKNVSREAKKYIRKNGSKYVVIGAHRELVEKFINALDKKTKEKVVGFYNIISGYNLKRIKEKSIEVIQNYEKKVETELVDDLLGKVGKKENKAVIGINSVTESFYLKKVFMLVIGDCRESGYTCAKCHFISPYIKICPFCKIKTAKAADLTDELIEEAIKSKVKIKHLVYPSKRFDKFGIGAFLRF